MYSFVLPIHFINEHLNHQILFRKFHGFLLTSVIFNFLLKKVYHFLFIRTLFKDFISRWSLEESRHCGVVVGLFADNLTRVKDNIVPEPDSSTINFRLLHQKLIFWTQVRRWRHLQWLLVLWKYLSLFIFSQRWTKEWRLRFTELLVKSCYLITWRLMLNFWSAFFYSDVLRISGEVWTTCTFVNILS